MKLPEDLEEVVSGYGGAPLVRRSYEESPTRVGKLQRVEGGCLGSVGLVWNRDGQVVLVRPDPGVWDVPWVAPGGMTEPGETPQETLLREVREETGLDVQRILALTQVFEMRVTDGVRLVEGFLFQFEALAQEGSLRSSGEILEARWFDSLPAGMAYRQDYLEAFEARRRGPPDRRFPPGV